MHPSHCNYRILISNYWGKSHTGWRLPLGYTRGPVRQTVRRLQFAFLNFTIPSSYWAMRPTRSVQGGAWSTKNLFYSTINCDLISISIAWSQKSLTIHARWAKWKASPSLEIRFGLERKSLSRHQVRFTPFFPCIYRCVFFCFLDHNK